MKGGVVTRVVLVLMGVFLCCIGAYAELPHDATPCGEVDEAAVKVPPDFSITFGSSPLHASWGGAMSVTVNARGEVTAEEDPEGRKRPGDRGEIKSYTVPAENVQAIYGAVLACRFFDLKERYWNQNIRDGERSYISVTAEGKTHEVTVYYWNVDRFDIIATVVMKAASEPREKEVPGGADRGRTH